MRRITIYNTDHNENGELERLGWFDLDAADLILKEASRWDGNNMRGVISGMQINRAHLYRTSGGRWVEHQDHSPEFNGPDTWRFLTDNEARDWMVKSGDTQAEEALERWFPQTPDEEGPNPKGGRPSVGPTFNVAFPRQLLDRVDAEAKKAGLTRAAWLRQVAAAAVGDSETRVPTDL